MKKYQIIYADPPWSFKTYVKGSGNGNVLNHYQTMSFKDIQDLPVKDISDDNCILFLWVTAPTLLQGLKTIEAWGFTYKTIGFNWVKRNKKSPSWFWGMGYWTRSNSEFCLIATKGKPKRMSAGVHQIIDTPIEQHSKKPALVREKIVELMGDIPRIELFARQKTEGWNSWGNEIENDIELLDNK